MIEFELVSIISLIDQGNIRAETVLYKLKCKELNDFRLSEN